MFDPDLLRKLLRRALIDLSNLPGTKMLIMYKFPFLGNCPWEKLLQTFLFSLLIVHLFPKGLFSQEDIIWRFVGGSLSGSTSASDINVNDASLGSGVVQSGFPSGFCTGNAWSVRDWWDNLSDPQSLSAAINQNEYVAFSFSVDARGQPFHVTQVSFDHNRSESSDYGPKYWAVYAGSQLFSGQNSGNCRNSSANVDIVVNPGETQTFRIYAWHDQSESTTNFTTMRFDNFLINGMVLPIELSRFELKLSGKDIALYWETSSELNNAYFAVQHSSDGQSFKTIGQVEGSGTTSVPQSYRFLDRSPLPGFNYYRLKQVDFDDGFAFSPVRAIRLPAMTRYSRELRVYPNPVQETLWIDLSPIRPSEGNQSIPIGIELFDLRGESVATKAVPRNPGQSFLSSIEVIELRPGSYILKVTEDEHAFYSLFVKN